MKKNNILKVVLVSLFIAVLLTWIFPMTTYSGGLDESKTHNIVGLFTLINYVPTVLQNFSHVGFYILIVGGFYGVLHSISGYRNLLDKIVKGFKGRECLFIVISIALIAIMTAMARMGVAVLFLFPFIGAILLLMGYDKITVAMVTAGGVAVGLMGTVFSLPPLEAQTDLANQLLSFSAIKEALFSTVDPAVLDKTVALSEWGVKLIILAIGIAVLSFNTVMYAKKHKKAVKEEAKEEESIYIPETKKKKESFLPLAIVFDITLIIMILSFLSWSNVFGQTWFVDVTEKIATLKVFSHPIFLYILGGNYGADVVPEFAGVIFGSWSLYELSGLIIIAALVIAFIYRIKANEFIQSFMTGVKMALKPAVIVTLVYLILVISVLNPVILTIVKPILTITNGFNIVTMSIAAFVTSVLGVDLYYSAPQILEYSVSLVNNASYHPLMALVWQGMTGLAALIAPTSVVLVATLSYFKVSYVSWLKATWKMLVEIFLALLIIFLIMFVII